MNPYLNMPLDRVRLDAKTGVTLARLAWRERDPEGAAREMGRVVEPVELKTQARERQERTALVGQRSNGTSPAS